MSPLARVDLVVLTLPANPQYWGCFNLGAWGVEIETPPVPLVHPFIHPYGLPLTPTGTSLPPIHYQHLRHTVCPVLNPLHSFAIIARHITFNLTLLLASSSPFITGLGRRRTPSRAIVPPWLCARIPTYYLIVAEYAVDPLPRLICLPSFPTQAPSKTSQPTALCLDYRYHSLPPYPALRPSLAFCSRKKSC